LSIKTLSILGSTGSIGVNALKIAEANPEKIQIKYLTAHQNVELLVAQSKKFHPTAVVIGNPEKLEFVQSVLIRENIEIFCGNDGLFEIAKRDDVDLVVNALVGKAGFKPTIFAL